MEAGSDLKKDSARRAAAFLVACGAMLFAAGCGGGPAPATFDLSATTGAAARAGLRGQLAVALPVTDQAHDSDRIVVRPGRDSIAYLTGAQWSESLPRLVQDRLVQSFENARLLKSVGRTGERISADHVLLTDIRSFDIDTTRNLAVVEITAKIVDSAGRIVAADVFAAEAAGSASSGQAAASALDAALGDAMRRIIAWTAARI